MMKVIPDWKEIGSVMKFVLTTFFIGFTLSLVVVACADEYYFGKTREELSREMFIVDSLIMDIKYQMDSTSIDFDRFYIDSQLDTHGYK